MLFLHAGGNAMRSVNDKYSGKIPEKELYIRWFQLTTFLQSMRISIAPWQYDAETVNISKSEFVDDKKVCLFKNQKLDFN